MIAALYVETNGVYFGLPNVDPWDEARDARLYAGPHPVVAHPPCERWGRYANGGPGFRGAVRPVPGNDNGCFAAALAALWMFGGVLEHPEGSAAWRALDLNRPPRGGGWVSTGKSGVWTCCVEQGNYGHRARKATWLLAKGVELPTLKWGPAPQQLLREAPGRRSTRTGVCQNLSAKQRRATSPAFAALLISIAESARPAGEHPGGRL